MCHLWATQSPLTVPGRCLASEPDLNVQAAWSQGRLCLLRWEPTGFRQLRLMGKKQTQQVQGFWLRSASEITGIGFRGTHSREV